MRILGRVSVSTATAPSVALFGRLFDMVLLISRFGFLLNVVSSPGCRAAKRGSKNAQKRDGREVVVVMGLLLVLIADGAC